MSSPSLKTKANNILHITEQMHAGAEENDWEKTRELQTVLDAELKSFFAQEITAQDAGIAREMIEKVMASQQQLKLSAQDAKRTIHTASKKLSNELAALAAYANSIE